MTNCREEGEKKGVQRLYARAEPLDNLLLCFVMLTCVNDVLTNSPNDNDDPQKLVCPFRNKVSIIKRKAFLGSPDLGQAINSGSNVMIRLPRNPT